MRRTPFIPRATVEIINLIKLIERHDVIFTINAKGPTCYVLSPLSNPKQRFTVSIGTEQKCSCKENGICVHILYVMMRYFGVPHDNNLLWQRSLTDHEIDLLINGYPLESESRSKQLKKSHSLVPKEKSGKIKRLPYGPRDLCPICYDTLINPRNERICWCHLGCGGNFHFLCLQQWIQSREDSGNKPSCPLCRKELDLDTIALSALASSTHHVPSHLAQTSHIKTKRLGTSHQQSNANISSQRSSPTFIRIKSGIPLNISPPLIDQQFQVRGHRITSFEQPSSSNNVFNTGRLPFDEVNVNEPKRSQYKTEERHLQPFMPPSRQPMWRANGEAPVVVNKYQVHPPKISQSISASNMNRPPPLVFFHLFNYFINFYDFTYHF